MDTTNDLEKRIEERLALREERRALQYNHTKQLMDELDARMKRYDHVADALMNTIICPQMERVRKCLAALNAPQWDSTRHTCKLLFKHTSQFPATATLELSITHDGQGKTLMIEYDASILPLFVRFNGKDQLSMPLESVDEAKVAAWIEERVLEFVDGYLSVETTRQYREENGATDPVCGMWLNKADAPAKIEYQGTAYFFCTGECREKFAENPHRYLTAAKSATAAPG
jgi:YHS domain-containing protein